MSQAAPSNTWWAAGLLVLAAMAAVVLGACVDRAPAATDPGGESVAAAQIAAATTNDLVAVILVYRDGSRRTYALADEAASPTATASLTPTPRPSATPIPTNTPRPTVTPTATATRTPSPTASRTPVVEPSPTPEAGTPIPVTPGPTPEPPDYGCFGTAQVNLNMRLEPSATALKVGSGLAAGQHMRVLYTNGADFPADMWLRIIHPDSGIQAWVAGYYQGSDFVLLDPSQECADMQWGTDGGGQLKHGVGFTLVPGAPEHLVQQFAVRMVAAGWVVALTVADGANAVSKYLAIPGVVVNWRPHYELGLSDCGEKSGVAPEAAAQARMNALRPHVSHWLGMWGALNVYPPRVVVQIENECLFPSPDYFNRWVIETTRLCTAWGWTCVPFVWSTGNPDVQWLPALQPAVTALLKGRHIWGMNTGPYKESLMLCDSSDPITPYTTWLGRLLRKQYPAFPVIWVTEAARGNATLPPIVADATCFVNESDAIYQMKSLWYAGPCAGAWAGACWPLEDALRLADALG